MEIFVEGLEFVGAHGVYAHEREEGRRFRVDLRVEVDQDQSTDSDHLSDTLDYRRLAECVMAVAEGPSCSLVEHMAQQILDLVLQKHSMVQTAQVTIRKAAKGVPGDPPWVGVTLVQHRHTA